jgi:putative FmdB family regulatory protein
MPEYDYKCEACGKSFSVTLGIAEHEKKRIKCPKCDSRKVRQRISSFVAMTSKKS